MRQRGVISTDLIIAGVSVLVLVAIVGGGFWYVGHVRAEAFTQGETAERAKWGERENKEIRALQADLETERARRAALEDQAAADLVALDEDHQKEVARVESAKDQFVSDVVAGRIRLLDPGRAAASQPVGDRAPGSAAGAGERDGQAAGRLSDAAAVFLYGEATRADEIVLQLTAAQGVIDSFERACK